MINTRRHIERVFFTYNTDLLLPAVIRLNETLYRNFIGNVTTLNFLFLTATAVTQFPHAFGK